MRASLLSVKFTYRYMRSRLLEAQVGRHSAIYVWIISHEYIAKMFWRFRWFPHCYVTLVLGFVNTLNSLTPIDPGSNFARFLGTMLTTEVQNASAWWLLIYYLTVRWIGEIKGTNLSNVCRVLVQVHLTSVAALHRNRFVRLLLGPYS